MSFVLLLLCIGQVPGSFPFDPARNWYTLETEHFSIHFSSPDWPGPEPKAQALRVAALAEEIHARMTAEIGWGPKPKTQVIVADFYDYANGWASPLPDNTITVIPTPPVGDRTNYDDWLRTLLTHEYAHIIQMDMARGLPGLARKVFGRIALPNALMPIWLLEGYAVHQETRFTSFGRSRSTEYDMLARTAARARKLLPIDRCGNYELERYPGGGAPYLYGSLFFKYLADKTRAGIWDEYSLGRAGCLPYFDNLSARRTFGKDFNSLWRDWQAALCRRADSVADHLSQKPVTRPKPLTREGYYTGSPCWSRTGSELYYVSRTGKDLPAVKAVDTCTGRTRVLHQGLVTGNLSLSPDGRTLAFAELRTVGNYYEHTDIRGLDLRTGEVRWLTSGMRAQDPDFSPDSAALAFTAYQGGRHDVLLLDLATGECRNLTESADRASFESPRFSPDGRCIAVRVHRPGGFSDIEVVDTKTGWNLPVTEDRANDLSPCWSRTGKYLLFVSDRTGVFNLHAYSMRKNETFACTNTLTGLFEPAVSPDNRRIALVTHSAGGDDLGLIDLDIREWQTAQPFVDSLPRPAEELPDSAYASMSKTALYHYNPFPTILPKLWIPIVLPAGATTAGALTFGWDALQLHRYLIAAGHVFGSTPFVTFSYEFRRYRPLFTLSGFAGLPQGAGPATDLNRQSLGLGLDLPFYQTWRHSWLSAGVDADRDSAIRTRSSVSATTSDALTYRFGVGPGRGGITGAYADFEYRAVAGHRDRTRALLYHRHYARVLTRSTTALVQLALGTALGDASQDSAWTLNPNPGILGVRGFDAESEAGRYGAHATVQVRTPLFWPERGLSTAPVFLRNINVALFSDWGAVWKSEFWDYQGVWDSSRLGVGVEARADLVLFHVLPVNVACGYGVGVRPETKGRFYGTVESSMLAGLLERRIEGRPRLGHRPE